MVKRFLFALASLLLASGAVQAQQLAPVVVASCGAQSLTPGVASRTYVDITGNLCSSSAGGGGGSVTQGTSPWVDNITQWASSPLGAMANYGTSPGAVLVPGVNAFVTAGSITANAGTNLNTSALALDTSVGTTNTDLGAVGSTTCATDTASCNINAKLSRIAERLTSILIATAVTIADGADVTQGAIADLAYAGSGNCTVVQCLKGIYAVAASSLAAGAAIIGKVGIDQSTPGTTNGVAVVGVNAATALAGNGATGTGSLRVTVASDNTPFATKVDQTTPGTTNGVAIVGVNAATALAGNGATGTGSQRVTIASDNTAFSVNAQPTPVTSGGLSVYFVQPTASDNHVVIKNGAGQVYKISVTNNSATINYLRLYNAGTGFNGCNSATNIVYQMAIPASTSGAGYSDSWESGIAFATGISICVSSGYATTDTTNATASAMSVNVGYK